MFDSISPAILNSAPHAPRLDLVSATRRSQGLHIADAVQQASEAFEAADDLLRALRRFQALRTDEPTEMRKWLAVTAAGALDQISNVMGAIDRDLDEQACNPLEPLDLSELTAFWQSVDVRDSDDEESGW